MFHVNNSMKRQTVVMGWQLKLWEITKTPFKFSIFYNTKWPIINRKAYCQHFTKNTFKITKTPFKIPRFYYKHTHYLLNIYNNTVYCQPWCQHFPDTFGTPFCTHHQKWDHFCQCLTQFLVHSTVQYCKFWLFCINTPHPTHLDCWLHQKAVFVNYVDKWLLFCQSDLYFVQTKSLLSIGSLNIIIW